MVNKQVNIYETEDIDTFFKAQGPFSPAPKGSYGYMGVVLHNKVDDTLQCHECGEWVKHLTSHAWNKHKIKSKAYKIKWGLPMSFGLVCKGISKKLHDDNIGKKKGAMGAKHVSMQTSNKANNNAKYARTNASFHNKHGICEKQTIERYVILAEQLGHEPTFREIDEHDSPLNTAIKRIYGNINSFRRANGFQQRKWKTSKGWTPEKVLGALRSFVENEMKFPEAKHFINPSVGYPSTKVISKHFGSVDKACILAGLERE